jgi:hypothetical protein
LGDTASAQTQGTSDLRFRLKTQGHDSPPVRSSNAPTRARLFVVAAVGVASIAFSIFCLYAVPIFGGLYGFSILGGLGCVAIALPSKANRIALVVGVFSITPIFRFIFFEKVAFLFCSCYVTFFVPL